MFGVCLDGDQDANYLQIFIQFKKREELLTILLAYLIGLFYFNILVDKFDESRVFLFVLFIDK